LNFDLFLNYFLLFTSTLIVRTKELSGFQLDCYVLSVQMKTIHFITLITVFDGLGMAATPSTTNICAADLH